ncbi:hypothetical protein QTP70_017327, partial [Hemibagrus guttatus]
MKGYKLQRIGVVVPLVLVSLPRDTLPSPKDYWTKAPFSEKEMFHILPKLQAKRADFLTVVLTGSLHQCRGFVATPPDTHDDGPKEDDVTKSESDSLDQSQDGPPSTLLAIDSQKGPRDPGSVADMDLDQEDISKTLVLFSPGDVRKSQNSGTGTDVLQSEKEAVDHQTFFLEKNQQPSTKYCDAGTAGVTSLSQQRCESLICTASPTPAIKMQKQQPAQKPLEDQKEKYDDRTPGLGFKQESNQQASSTNPPLTKDHLEEGPFKNQCFDPGDLGFSNLVRQKISPSANVLVPSSSAASPPFTKVERTFIHIAETTHLNVMSSRVPQVPSKSPEVSEGYQCEVEPQTRTIILEAGGVWSKVSSCSPAEVQKHNVVNGPVQSQVPVKVDFIVSSFSMGTKQHVQREALPEKPKDKFQQGTAEDKPGDKMRSTSSHLRSRSRIPVLVLEDSAAADPSLSWDQTQKRSKQQEFARMVLERQRQALNSRASSSLSSGDEPMRASETLSTTEEDTQQSDDSIGKVKQEVRERGGGGWSSRIPRPVTPVKRAPAKLLLAFAAKSTVKPDTTTNTANT